MATVSSHPTVSDGLQAIIRRVEPARRTGLVMVRRDVEAFLEGLQALHDAAKCLENISERAIWNDQARREQGKVDRKALEAGIADGTVAVFPVAARPVPQRRSPEEGGAA